MKDNEYDRTRRNFVKTAAGALIAANISSFNKLKAQQKQPVSKPKTNIADALKYPLNKLSIPGLYPGCVVEINNKKAIDNCVFNYEEISYMLDNAMMLLTAQPDRKKAWGQFFSPTDRIGIKVNTLAGKLLSSSHEIVRAIITFLVNIGVQPENIFIWDRREYHLIDAGFTSESFPLVKIIGTERKDALGSFYDNEGKLYSENMIDKSWFYWADVDGEYDKDIMPLMVNGGKYSYFSKICTQMVDKIINVPVLKNAGNTVTLCLENMAYGSISNTARLHKDLWAESCAEVPCFPPLRNKVVLNIVDGIKGCYQGGPSAHPEYITEFNTLIVGTDPVAVDRVGFSIILDKREEKGIQKELIPESMNFLYYAEKLGLGIADLRNIQIKKLAI